MKLLVGTLVKNSKNKDRKILKALKIALLILSSFSIIAVNKNIVEATAKGEEPLAVLYSASDFQNKNGHEQGVRELRKITDKIYDSGYSEITEALICGDYYYEDEVSAELSEKGIESIQNTLYEYWGLEYDDIYFVQGNHDPSKTTNLDVTGGTEREYYSVYQINHDDFMWSQKENINIEDYVMETARNLELWLENKIEIGYQKPIFIITHLPLHHSYRYDNPYSEYIFDVLNDAGEKGLNILYLYGHNHSKEYDQYLGGSAVYLAKGEQIIIPDLQGESASDYKTETLNFTYMNAGYIGNTSDGIQSSCIFEIYEDKIEVKRYTSEGIYDLKNSGVSSQNDLGWNANEKIVKSPQIIELNNLIISIDDSLLEQDSLMLDINQSANVGININNSDNYSVIWTSSNSTVAEVAADEKNALKAMVIGKSYGETTITATVDDLTDRESVPVKLTVTIFVSPKDAVRISYGDNVRFYGIVENIPIELMKEGALSREYMILNSNQQGRANAFMIQSDEYVTTEEMTVIYVPGVGEIVTPNTLKTLLWNFEEVDGPLENVTEYRLKVSAKAPYRFKYYIAVTSGVDSGLGYPNLTNMRTCSTETSDGTALFWFDDKTVSESELVTSYHYKKHFKENENGAFRLCYDETSNEFVLDNTTNGKPVYYYGRIDTAISDLFMWTDAEGGAADIDSEEKVETGGTIKVMYEGVIEEIPITLEMLSGIDRDVPGKYICTVTFNGKIISDNYELTLKNTNSGISQIIMMIKNFFESIGEISF